MHARAWARVMKAVLFCQGAYARFSGAPLGPDLGNMANKADVQLLLARLSNAHEQLQVSEQWAGLNSTPEIFFFFISRLVMSCMSLSMTLYVFFGL